MSFVALLIFLSLATAQTPGTSPEVHPKLLTWVCKNDNGGGCTEQTSAVVLDALSHPVHQVENTDLGCGVWGSPPNGTVCPDEATCAKNCIVEGISDYAPYGVSTDGGSLTLSQLNSAGSTVSPRLYLLDNSEEGGKYEMLQLTGKELSFDVDISKLPCGMNGALYLSEMEADGGQSELNVGGAAYGTGYCDAQCFTFPFVNGVGNIEGKGSCCNEMDIWEANKAATSIAPHTCNQTSLYQCTGDECTFDGVCDQWGCSYNPYALGHRDYYGPGLTVDTSRPFTVVTQFPAQNGVLQEIRRLYVQDGKVIENAAISTTSSENSLTNEYCSNSGSRFMDLGGIDGMGEALSRGMVLIFSIWWDTDTFMNWMDSGDAGPCNATEGDPNVIVQVEPSPSVTFSKIKWGDIGSTYT